ncbi:MAG: DUF3592 domain-containing protein, partial [bacterium]
MNKQGLLRNWGCLIIAGSLVLVSLIMGGTSLNQIQAWGFIVASLGLVLIWVNRDMLYSIVASYLWWGKVEGTIQRSKILTGEEGFKAWKKWVKEMSDEEWHDWIEKQAEKRSATDEYFVQLEYEYTVNDETYQSHRYSTYQMPPNFDTRKEAEKLTEQHPDGSRVQVRYNPADPGEAFLDPVGSSMEKGALGVSSALILIGSWMLIGAPGKIWALVLLFGGTAVAMAGAALKEKLRADRRT